MRVTFIIIYLLKIRCYESLCEESHGVLVLELLLMLTQAMLMVCLRIL